MPADSYITPAPRSPGTPGSEVAIAAGQYGVISRRQLAEAGVSAAAIGRWMRAGRLTRLHAGVYSLGHAVLVPDGRRLAAVLACGPSGHLAEGDAGAVFGMCESWGSRFSVVVAPGAARRGRRPGIHVRECVLTAADVAVVRGIPVTGWARTVVDIAAVRPERTEEVIDAAISLGLYDQEAMDRQLATPRRGVGVVRAVLAERHPESHRTKSRWEAAMLRLLATHQLPPPAVNVWLADLRVEPDLLWADAALVVEWDSWTHHRTRSRFESDRRKTIVLQTAGYTVLRFTWRQTREEPELVAAAIRSALTASRERVRGRAVHRDR